MTSTLPTATTALSPARVALFHLAASSAAALLSTPGGLGSLDAALAFALTVTGASIAAEASAVLGYRLLTVPAARAAR